VTARPDRELVERKLATMRLSLEHLGSPGPVDRDLLESDPAIGLVVERTLALLADLALAINNHVAGALLGEVPQTAAASFDAVRKAGLIDADLVAALTPPDGPHHLLVQLCLDSEPEQVAAIVASALSGYAEYVLAGEPLERRTRSADVRSGRSRFRLMRHVLDERDSRVQAGPPLPVDRGKGCLGAIAR
jgi:uncharacterized protein YutE (UPF0331/DUF86 family)